MCRPSLAAVVVLPEPCRPTSEITAGLPCSRNVRSPADRSSTSSSWTILTTCCPAVRLPRISAPIARSRIRPTTSLTTLKLTSASRRASRISRAAASTSASVTRPRPVRLASVVRRRSLRLSNTRANGLRSRPDGDERGDLPRVGRAGSGAPAPGQCSGSAAEVEGNGLALVPGLNDQPEPAGHAARDLEAREQAALRLARPDQLDRLAVAVPSRPDHHAIRQAQPDVVAGEREATGEGAQVRDVVGEREGIQAGDELLRPVRQVPAEDAAAEREAQVPGRAGAGHAKRDRLEVEQVAARSGKRDPCDVLEILADQHDALLDRGDALQLVGHERRGDAVRGDGRDLRLPRRLDGRVARRHIDEQPDPTIQLALVVAGILDPKTDLHRTAPLVQGRDGIIDVDDQALVPDRRAELVRDRGRCRLRRRRGGRRGRWNGRVDAAGEQRHRHRERGLAPDASLPAHVVASNSAATNAAGSKSTRSSGRSPTPAKRTGTPSRRSIANTIPPRAVESSLVRTIPVSPT